MRLIDADALPKEISWDKIENTAFWETINEQPTIDAVPVIRCKDCKHRHLDGMIWNCPFGLSGGEDFFCAYGAKDGDSNDE